MTLLPLITSTGPYGIDIGVGATNTTWPSANRIYYMPVRIPEDCTVKRVFWTNSTSPSGNLNLGLYDKTGAKLWETGSTAMTGSNQAQFVDISDEAVTAGFYYIALQHSATANIVRVLSSGGPHVFAAAGVMQESAGGFALPSTATYERIATDFIPVCGLDLRGAV